MDLRSSSSCAFRPLVRDSLKDFENAAVALAADLPALHLLQQRLAVAITQQRAIFSPFQPSRDFVRAAAAVWDAAQSQGRGGRAVGKEEESRRSRKPHVLVRRGR